MALKPSLIRNALGVRLGRPATVDEAVEALGGGARGRSAVAQRISGTTDKSSREYKNARRNVERWTTTTGRRQRPTKLMPRIRSSLTAAVEKQREQQLAERMRGPIVVTWHDPVVLVSEREGERDRPDIQEEVPDSYLEEFREAMGRGDEREAINAIARATLAAWFDVPYGQAPGEITEASGLTIHGLSG